MAILRRVLLVIATIGLSASNAASSGAATTGHSITWASLGVVRPTLIQPAGWGSPIAAEPRSSTLGWCSPKGVEIARGGESPTLVSVSSVGRLLQSSHLGLHDSPESLKIAVTCEDVALNPSHPKTVYAGFEASRGGSIPPVYNVALVSSNFGKSWRFIPPPRAYPLTAFAGFIERPGGVEVLYSRKIFFPMKPGQSATIVAATSPTGGQSWMDTHLGCSANGTCVIFGPQAPQGACGMSEWQQSVLVIATGQGTKTARWRSAGAVKSVSQCGSQQLVATTSGDEFLVDRSRANALIFTRDGIHWTTVSLPKMNGVPVGGQFAPFGEVMTIAADGTLVAVSGSALQTAEHLVILKPGSNSWCAATAALPAATMHDPVAAIQSSKSTLVVAFLTPIATTHGKKSIALTFPLSTLRCRN